MKIVILISTAFILGQMSIMEAYNPEGLKEVSLTLAKISYLCGCRQALGRNCIDKSTDYLKGLQTHIK